MTEDDFDESERITNFVGKDRAGEHVYYLTFLEPAFKHKRKIYWKCECDCHNITYVRYDQAVDGEIKSCGCFKESKHIHAGDTFGRLTARKRVENNKFGHNMWYCDCSCGGNAIVESGKLKSGHTQSCGCIDRRDMSLVHTVSESILYSKYYDMLGRCYNIENYSYKYYGGRGVKCIWNSFEEFYADMGESFKLHLKEFGQKDTTLDRIDSNKDYCRENCRWATLKEQANNKRSNRHVTDSKGITKTITQWSEYTGINVATIRHRLYDYKWDIDDALYTKPLRSRVNE